MLHNDLPNCKCHEHAVLKFMRPPSFCNPKRVIAPKWEQIGPKLVFPVFQAEITRNHGHRPNLKPSG